MESLRWDILGAIFGGLSVLLTFIIYWKQLGTWRGITVAVFVGLLVFIIIKVVTTLIFPHSQTYDDFNNPKYEARLNTSLWTDTFSESCKIYQQNGVLVFRNSISQEDLNCEIYVNQEPMPIGKLPTTIQAKLRVSSDHNGNSINHTINYFTKDLPGIEWNGWYTACGIWVGSDGVYLAFDVRNIGAGKDSEIFKKFPAEYDKWYEVRLELDPQTMQTTCYVDKTLFASILPSDSAKLRNASFTMSSNSWRSTGATATTYMDDMTLLP